MVAPHRLGLTLCIISLVAAGCPNADGEGSDSEANSSTGADSDGEATQGPDDEDSTTADSDSESDTSASPTSSTSSEPATSGTTSGTTNPTASTGGSEEGSSSADDDTTGVAVDQLPPIGDAALRPWLEAGAYSDWATESAVHGSAGPHFGDVRTFVNDALFDSLGSGGNEHPVEAAAVKELYGDGATARGWAVMIKTAAGGAGDTWYWSEVYDDSALADGQGLGGCTGCHGKGTDFVRSPFPLQ